MQKISKNQVLKIIKNANNDSTYEIEMLDDNHAKLILFVTIKAKDNKSSMTTKQFQEFMINFVNEQKLVNQKQEETNKIVMQRLDKQEEFNQMILQKVDNIDQRLIKVENDIKLIKSCPTIQKELNSK